MKPLLVIVGETASGKSSLALELAKRCNGEIISADSWAVYKGFNIGTAKPTKSEQLLVKHYLIDVVEPDEGFSAVAFQKQARAAIDQIYKRGKLPMLVGGTGLYIDSIIYDYGFLPATDPKWREELNALTLAELLSRADTQGLDMSDIDVRNKRRVIRLIENKGKRPTKKPMRPNTLLLGLKIDSIDLQNRVGQRVDSMLDTGLEAEVLQLVKHYGWNVEAMKGVGYWQWKDYYEGLQTLDETRIKIIKSTKDLAKRQRTWFKRNKSIHWLITEDKITEAVELVTTLLDNLP